MKIVQTFWHGNNSLLDNSFGWMNPQYHLMSWALSCLSLKDNYQNIVLYTDSHGYEIFAEQLKLPYTDIIIQYDNLTCPEPHWAYPKLLTYSLQKEPFIHVDGTVFIEGMVYYKDKWYLYYGCADSKVGMAIYNPKKPAAADPLP